MSRTICQRAYTDTHALNAHRPRCRAPIGQYCTRTDEHGTHIRHVPCIARIKPLDAEVALHTTDVYI